MFLKSKKTVGSVLKQLQRQREALKSQVDAQNARLSLLWTFLEARFGKVQRPFDIPAMQQQILQFSNEAEAERKEKDRIKQERDSLSRELSIINAAPAGDFPHGKGKVRQQLHEAKMRISELLDEREELREEVELLRGPSSPANGASVAPPPKPQVQRAKWDDLLKDI
jgi:hypothetical protein